jgi:hypothetical protein
MPSLFDIDQFAALSTLADEMDVTFELHGGVAFRFALNEARYRQPDGGPVDLFDLTPFTADIDLLHSGTSRLTRKLLIRILQTVPNADCFRWEIRSQDTQEPFRSAAPFESQVPARQFSLTADGWQDPLDGLADVRRMQFRYLRNREYRNSPLYQKGRGLEIFSALLYLQTLLEADVSLEDAARQPGGEDARAVFFEAASNETLLALRAQGYLRRRLSYLLVNCVAAARPDVFWSYARLFALDEFLRWIAGIEGAIPDELRDYFGAPDARTRPRVLSPSSPLRQDLRRPEDSHRLPFATELWREGGVVAHDFAGASVHLAPELQLIMASPKIDLAAGRADFCPQEFIYFALPQDYDGGGAGRFSDVDLSVLAVARAWWWRFWPWPRRSVHAMPCIVQRTRGRRGEPQNMFIRVNTVGLFDIFARYRGAQVQFFLVAHRGDAE